MEFLDPAHHLSGEELPGFDEGQAFLFLTDFSLPEINRNDSRNDIHAGREFFRDQGAGDFPGFRFIGTCEVNADQTAVWRWSGVSSLALSWEVPLRR